MSFVVNITTLRLRILKSLSGKSVVKYNLLELTFIFWLDETWGSEQTVGLR